MKTLKETLLVISLLFFINIVSGQAWKEMMFDPSVNVYDVVDEAEAYFQNIDKNAKGSGWKPYQRWLFENEPKFYPSGDRSNVDPYFVSHAFKGFLRGNPSSARSLFTAGWEELGPYYIGQVTGHYSLGLGRVESFYADPNDTLRIYLGSRSGGFWKTLDGGATWKGNTTDSLFATGVNTMTVSPTNPDSILINVRNSRNGTTHGIYRSVDAGDSWVVTSFNPTNLGWGGMGSNRQVYQIAYHPTVPGLVFIGTNEGLFRSSNELSTWTTPVAALDFRAIAFHPTNPDIIYASTSNNNTAIYVSTNRGLTFNVSNTLVGNSKSIKMSTTAACPNCVYVGTSDGIWKSVDEGQNFGLLSTPGLSNYGAFAVSDVDTNYVLFGNIDVNMSADEGQNFNRATVWSQGNAGYKTNGSYVHADIRGSRCENGVFWVNTDGFLCKSKDNGVTWQLFEGQSIRENYNLGLSQSNHERTISGSQDNGTSIKTENSWIEFYGADGMEGIIHPLNDDWMIGSVQYGTRRRTKDGGTTQQSVTPSGQSGAWIAPLFYDPNDQMTVYHVGENLYKSTDFGSNWTQLGTPSFSGTIGYATIAENNSNIIVVSKSQRIEKSIDGGLTFTNIRGSLPNSSITDIAFDPNDDNVMVVTYATYQNNNSKVYITTDQGLTWQNITYNLNNMPVRSVVIDHTDASTLYLGTEIGVFKKAMTDVSWSLYNPGLPNMSVLELEVMYGSNTLRAATWGRGLWEYTLDGRQSFPSILTTRITEQPTDSKPFAGVNQFVTSTITYDDTLTNVYVEWSVNAPVFGNVISMTNTVDSTWVSNLSIPNQVPGTKVYFKVFAVGTSGDTTETYKFMYEVKDLIYCQSFGNMSYTTGVTLVDFNTINNATGKTQPYTDYTASDSTTVEIGSSHNLNVNLDTDGNYTIRSRAWIDWNHDGDFFDAGESFELGSAQNTANGPTTNSPLAITIPLTAKLGKTKMRVSAKYNVAPSPCETGFDGEVEDYSIIIDKMRLVDSVALTFCSNDSIFAGGQWQHSVGVYYDTVYVSSIADSVYVTTLSLGISTSTTTQVACGSYTWPLNSANYTTGGSYATTLTNAAGCDSIVTLNLTLNNSVSSSETITACDTYTWSANSTNYTTGGSYATTLTSATGCDSIVTLNLTLNNSVSSSETITACDTYTWSEKSSNYTTSGTYATTLTSATGCDSIVTLNLTLNNSVSSSETITACDTYTWSANSTNYTTGGSYATTLTSATGCDSIVTLNLTLNNGVSSSETIAACNTYTWLANGTNYTSSGTYTEVLTSINGCDSTVTLSLTVNSLNSSVSQIGAELTADETGATYQWLNCPALTPISGATTQSYTAPSNGDYAVIINNNGCSDTSACYTVVSVGIVENDFGTGFLVYPNPTDGNFSIALGAKYPSITITLTDIKGKFIQSNIYKDSQLLNLNIEEAAGVYLLMIESEDKKAVIRLVRE
ncbi:GEVED domain-containing protein [bacterium]|nr:GEVED domain-containing protein [bacterium]